MELWSGKNDNLVSKQEWEQRIDTLREESTKKCNKEEVKQALINAVKQRIPQHKYGIFLSGGVDSSLISVLADKNAIFYTVGYESTIEARDVTASRTLVQKYNLSWRLTILTLKEVEKYITQAIHILSAVNLIDSVTIGIAIVIIAATEQAKKENITTFLGGLGAEEIFAGYKRHLDVTDVNEECWRGLHAMWSRDLVRDATLASALKIDVRTPFLDEQLIKSAMQIPGNRKIKDGQRKIILREIAEEIGIPKEIAWRNKQAAQYGSSIDKAIAKLAKINGYNDKGVYLRHISKSL